MLLCLSIFIFRWIWISTHTNIFTEYIIEKNNHYSYDNADLFRWRRKFDFTVANELTFQCVFGRGCNHQPIKGEDKYDINKLYGVSFSLDPRDNSIRIGWRYDEEKAKIKIYVYAHYDRSTIIKELGEVRLGERFLCSLDFIKTVDSDGLNRVLCSLHKYNEQQRLESTSTFTSKARFNRLGVKFKLYPYFGGNQVAPNDMKILIKTI